jgi:hypothetical protein
VPTSPGPTIKTYGDLVADDLERHPVWVNCHEDDAGEDDYRPHDGPPPRLPYDNLYVVRAEALLADGTRLDALINLSPETGGIDAEVFGDNGRVSLRSATMGLGENVRLADLAALGRAEDQIFPVRVSAGAAYPTITVLDWFTQRVTLP